MTGGEIAKPPKTPVFTGVKKNKNSVRSSADYVGLTVFGGATRGFEQAGIGLENEQEISPKKIANERAIQLGRLTDLDSVERVVRDEVYERQPYDARRQLYRRV